MRGSAIIALAVLATSMIVEDATAVDSSEQKDLTQLLKADQVHFEEHKDTSQRGISNESNLNSRQPDKAELACHQKGFGSRQHAFAKCPISLLGEVSGQHRLCSLTDRWVRPVLISNCMADIFAEFQCALLLLFQTGGHHGRNMLL